MSGSRTTANETHFTEQGEPLGPMKTYHIGPPAQTSPVMLQIVSQGSSELPHLSYTLRALAGVGIML